MGLEDLIRKFADRREPYSKALYWLGGAGKGWQVHVPASGPAHAYIVYYGDDLAETLTRALSGHSDRNVPSNLVPMAVPEDPEIAELI